MLLSLLRYLPTHLPTNLHTYPITYLLTHPPTYPSTYLLSFKLRRLLPALNVILFGTHWPLFFRCFLQNPTLYFELQKDWSGSPVVKMKMLIILVGGQDPSD